MPSTYTLIASNVLGSSAASVTFSSIPSTYTDLVLRISARADTTGPKNLGFTFNTDTSTNYSQTYVQGDGSAASSGRFSTQATNRVMNAITGTDYTSNTFGSVEIYIPDYLSSANKPNSAFGTTENDSTSSTISATANLWRGTTAINQIVLALGGGGNFISTSSFYLYGIKNS